MAQASTPIPFDAEDPKNPVIVDGEVTWTFDADFLNSNWTCIWGRGCLGIHDDPSEELQQGCCSVGAELDGEDESRLISALAAMIDPALFQFHDASVEGGVFANEKATNTRVVDGACIFLNRTDFHLGAGCALHVGAVQADERPMDWKPEVCWQVPVRYHYETDETGHTTFILREWKRRDWGEGGAEFHWWCTEDPEAFVGHERVVDSLEDEIRGLVGDEVYELLVDHLDDRATGTVFLPHPAVRRPR